MSNEHEYKHTPGPWMRADNQISPYSVQIVGNRVEYLRGEATVTAVALVLGNETSQHTTAANARLIAAAPDLLAAAKALLEVGCDNCSENGCDTLDCECTCHENEDAARCLARVAIAAAEKGAKK